MPAGAVELEVAVAVAGVEPLPLPLPLPLEVHGAGAPLLFAPPPPASAVSRSTAAECRSSMRYSKLHAPAEHNNHILVLVIHCLVRRGSEAADNE